jgi:cytochrome c553
MKACVVCHGKEGRATSSGYFPRIAGKPAGYLYNQLVNFRAGRRTNGTMVYLVEHMSDDYLREIAAYFSSQDLPYPPPEPTSASESVLARGEALVRRGDPQRKLPACAQCHGESLLGIAPFTPALVGLSRYYLAGQFGAWQNGLRKAKPPDCMAQILKRMPADDIGAVAAWLSSRPIPADAKPQTGLDPSRLPMECGSWSK